MTDQIQRLPVETPPSAELGTIIGLVSGFALVVAAVVLGGAPAAFIDLPSIFIVIGGTLCITLVSFPFREIVETQALLKTALVRGRTSPREAATEVLRIADRSRGRGAMAVERAVPRAGLDPFLRRALAIVADGMPAQEIERMLDDEIATSRARHARGAGVLRRAAEISPAMGLIGTLVGLVQMLGRLEDPAGIGPAMAVALLTTFYGAILATMVFTPLAAKLERTASDETIIYRIYAIAAAGLSRQENPRRIELMINAILPPAERVSYFD